VKFGPVPLAAIIVCFFANTNGIYFSCVCIALEANIRSSNPCPFGFLSVALVRSEIHLSFHPFPEPEPHLGHVLNGPILGSSTSSGLGVSYSSFLLKISRLQEYSFGAIHFTEKDYVFLSAVRFWSISTC